MMMNSHCSRSHVLHIENAETMEMNDTAEKGECRYHDKKRDETHEWRSIGLIKLIHLVYVDPLIIE